MYVFEIRCTETDEVLETHETGAAAGERSRQLNDQLREAGVDRRTRVKRVEAPAAEEIPPYAWVYVNKTNGHVDYVNTDAWYRGNPEYRLAPIPNQEGIHWRARELNRSGRHEIPWLLEDWWLDSEAVLTHFIHPSRVDPAKLAYTESEEHGLSDRQTRTTPGRYLRRYFGDVLTAEQIEYWAVCWTETFAPRQLQFATSPDEIEWVYSEGPHSCMAYTADHFIAGIHPCRVYGTGDLAVAYITNRKGDPTGRCLVWPEKKIYGNIYGDVHRMETAFEEAGYTHAPPNGFDGARLLRIPFGSGFVLPYFDFPIQAVEDTGEYLVIDRAGDIYGERTDGLSAPMALCSACGYEVAEDEARSDNDGNEYCVDCFFERFTYCHQCGEYEDAETSVSTAPYDESVCQSCAENYFVLCTDCEELHHGNRVFTGPDDIERCGDCHADYVAICADCGDDYMVGAGVENEDGDEVCPDCATGDTASDPVTSSKDPNACTCARNREAARAEAIAARDPLLARVGPEHRAEVFNAPADYARTVAERDDEERIEAAVAAVPSCDSCREQAGQLTLSFDAPAPVPETPEHTCAWRVADDTGSLVPCGAPSTHRSTYIGDWYTLCEQHAAEVPSIMERFTPPPAPEPKLCVFGCGNVATRQGVISGSPYCEDCATALFRYLDDTAPRIVTETVSTH